MFCLLGPRMQFSTSRVKGRIKSAQEERKRNINYALLLYWGEMFTLGIQSFHCFSHFIFKYS